MQRESKSMKFLLVAPAVLAFCLAMQAAEQGRGFPGLGCRFTLPNQDWFWVEPTQPNVLFAAATKDGLSLTAICDRPKYRSSVDQIAANVFERALNQSSGGQLTKRGGMFITIQGTPCYQFHGAYPDGRTTVSRLIQTNDFTYHLMLVGKNGPVEQRPDFEQIMSGFAFTVPPPVPAEPAKGSNADLIVIIFGIICCIVGATLRHLWRQKPKARSALRDDFRHDRLPAPPQFTGSSRATAAAPAAWDAPQNSAIELENGGLAECRHCGYQSVSAEARHCPNCGKAGPLPGVISRWAGRGAMAGMLFGGIGGAVWGYSVLAGGGVSGFIAGGVLGFIFGLPLGMGGGLVAGIAARVAGHR
jgi:hypothetical protein